MDGYKPMVINVALTGAVPSKMDNALVPLTPAEIVADVLACAAAGATSLHIHGRGAGGGPVPPRAPHAATGGPAGGPPHPRRVLPGPVNVAMPPVRRLEAEDANGHQCGELRPEARPEAGRLNCNPGDVTDFFRHLRLVAEIGDEHDITRRDVE